jgi:phosphoglycerate kinase
MVVIASHLTTFSLPGQRVFVRADLNIPLHHNTIMNDHRLKGLLPTLNYLRDHSALMIIATHLGRPTHEDPALSTRHLIPWFEHQGYEVIFETDLERAYHLSTVLKPPQLLLLENLRFFPGEKTGDIFFAQQLKKLADYYVNDAFGVLHRHDTSITLLPELFAPNKRTIGFLVEHELTMLHKLLENPAHPFVMAIGGGKVADKIPMLKHILSTIDTLLLCPAIVFTFLKAQHKPVGKSLVDLPGLELCADIMQQATRQGVKIITPIDYQIAYETFNGPLSYADADQFPDNAVGVSIGPKTAALFTQYIRNSQTIFYNGAMGNLTRPDTLQAMHALLQAMANTKALSVVAGGDSVAVAYAYKLNTSISLLSTGGGSTLAYLSGTPLPGLQAFIQK